MPDLSNHPAVGLIELDSIAHGVLTGDAMVKASPVTSIHAGTVHPGRYLVMVAGDTASVDVALDVGGRVGGTAVLDSMFLPDIHSDVVAAVVRADETAVFDGEAVGVLETATAAAVIDAADAGVKAARVTLATVRLADGLGGKGYLVFGGAVAEVEAAIESSVARAEPTDQLLHSVVIPQLAAEMRANLMAELRFNRRLEMTPLGSGD